MDKEQSVEEIRERIKLIYDVNNIIREKSELYYDFIIGLLNVIDETYLGSEVISTQEDMSNHFIWCFNKILKNFEREKIKFSPISIVDQPSNNSSNAYDYLWYFMYKGYYSSDMEKKYEALLEYFTYLFDYTGIKTPIEIDTYIDFYKIFDQNLKKLN